MTRDFDNELPELEEFELENVVFKVVDPTLLPPKTLSAFEQFMAGSSAPHPVFVYSHDYARFCMMTRKGHISID
ncbi:hypothetical protein ACED66_02875 [Vibrio splendidus]|uniref:hypothetical protein n=1 Tax=Vibrio splendidus TaxID=29497 RepID=UPI000D39F02C|nr:hypothetical protein [Vibrio splendidus]PTQ10458.1 hypothetical protein CWO28_01425 [Vibrio splendidus]